MTLPSKKRTAPVAGCLMPESAAFTLVEVMVAASLIVIGLAGIFVLGGQMTGVLRSTKETAWATQAVQERMEQLNYASWQQLTYNYSETSVASGSYPPAGLISMMQQLPDSLDELTAPVETITVTAYPVPSPANPITVTRTGTGTPVASTNNYDLVDAQKIKVKVRVSWTVRTASGGPIRVQESSTIIAQNGAPDPPTSIVAVPDLPPTPDATPTPRPVTSTPTPTPTPTATPTATPAKCRHGKVFSHCGKA